MLGHAVGSAFGGGDHVIQHMDSEGAEDVLQLDGAGDVLGAGGTCSAGVVVGEKQAVSVGKQGEGGHNSGIGGYLAEAALYAVDAEGPALGIDGDDGEFFEAFRLVQPLAESFEFAPVGDPGDLVFHAGFGEDDSLMGDRDGASSRMLAAGSMNLRASSMIVCSVLIFVLSMGWPLFLRLSADLRRVPFGTIIIVSEKG